MPVSDQPSLDPHWYPDWRSDAGYRILLGADVPAFAWEWTRRSRRYVEAWKAHRNSDAGHLARRFGLERFEDPALGSPAARPVWAGTVDRNVIRAQVSDPSAPPGDRIDLRLISHIVTIAIGEDEVEHLLLSDGLHFIRIDVIVGTLIGCPSALTYLLHGISGLSGPMRALAQFRTLVESGRFAKYGSGSPMQQMRWLTELRVADALRAGCGQQTIARALFGDAIRPRKWRSESAPYRRRVQRLVAAARSQLKDPLRRWFGTTAVETSSPDEV